MDLKDETEMLKEKLTKAIDVKDSLSDIYLNMKEEFNISDKKIRNFKGKTEMEKNKCQVLSGKLAEACSMNLKAEMSLIYEKLKHSYIVSTMEDYHHQFEDRRKNETETKINKQNRDRKDNGIKDIEKATERAKELETKIRNVQQEYDGLLKEITNKEETCNITKKRNAAKLLRLRKNLQESEMKRRQMMLSQPLHATAQATPNK